MRSFPDKGLEKAIVLLLDKCLDIRLIKELVFLRKGLDETEINCSLLPLYLG